MPVKKVCDECGGDSVYILTTAYWDVDKQDWVLSDGFYPDEYYCGECSNQINIVDVEINNPEGKP